MDSNRPLTADEEALKRNTDCLYFLASPFTCKKGTECEFRHSEGARVNPRDCWYWMNGSCLNPKCAFRHPPLDGLFGIPATPSGPLPSSFQAGAHAPAAYNTNKQSVPCYYFQKGQCLKGDMCQFMHGPQPGSNHAAEHVTNGPQLAFNNDPQQLTNGPHPTANHATQQAANVTTSFSGTSQTVSWGLKECNTAHQTIRKICVDRQVEELHPSAKSANRCEVRVNGLPVMRSPSSHPLKCEPPRVQPTVVPVGSDISPSRRHHHRHQPTEEHYSNGRETDDLLGESSPGFDVLVHDGEDYGRDPDYYHNDDEYGIASVHGGRNPNHSANDFDYTQIDYDAVSNFEREQYDGKGEYDQYGRAHGHYDREHPGASSEKPMDRMHKRRRPIHRDSSPNEMDGSDLRRRLLKQQKRNGLRSPVSPDRHGEPRRKDDRYAEGRYRGHPSGRDMDKHPVLPKSSFGSRLRGRITLPARSPPHLPIELRGRITLPARSPPHLPIELQSERDRDRERSRGRLSPVRPINYKGRPQDRTRWSQGEECTAGRRSFRVRSNRRDDGGPLNFAAPKTLAELKGAKAYRSSEEQPAKGLNAPLAAGFQAPEESPSFEGPKPLSEILKRKREGSSGNDSVPSSGDESKGRNAEGLVDSAAAAAAVKDDHDVSDAQKLEIRKPVEEGIIPREGASVRDDTPEEVDGMTAKAAEDQELEDFDAKDGDYADAIEDEEGEYVYQDDENMYQDDEDDEDDFAKTVGVFFKKI